RFHGPDVPIVVERLLNITGEDALTVHRKYKDAVTLKLNTRFMFLTNELPRLHESSSALAGRFVILRLTESFFGHEDHGLTPRLLTELPGILNWAIQGWHRLNQRGRLVEPGKTSELARDLEELASPIIEFVRECCDLGIGLRTQVADLYQAWVEWSEKNG